VRARGKLSDISTAEREARKRRRAAMLISAPGYLSLGSGAGELLLAVRPPTVPDLLALSRWAVSQALGQAITASLAGLDCPGLTADERAGIAQACAAEHGERGLTADGLMDVFGSADGAGLILWHAAGGSGCGHAIARIRGAVAEAGPGEILDRLDAVLALPAEDGSALDMGLTWRGLLAAECLGPAGWGKVYRTYQENWGLLPHELDLYPVPRIMAMAVPDGKVSKEQFDEMRAARRRQRGKE
jgi:hypothetical protein